MGREKRLGFETTLLVYIWVCVSVWVILKKKKKRKKNDPETKTWVQVVCLGGHRREPT